MKLNYKTNMELIFKIANLSVIPAWILIAFFPKSIITKKLVFSYWWHIVLAITYAIFIFWGMYENTSGSMESLSNLRLSFKNDSILLAAWIHYLVFDLFVGVWIVKEAEKLSLNKVIVIPILFFTLMLGPVGFLLFFVLWKIKKQT